MIGFLRGKVAHLLPDYCLLDVGGVGYRVFIAAATRSRDEHTIADTAYIQQAVIRQKMCNLTS